MKKLLHILTSIMLVISLQAQSVWDGGAGTTNWQDATNWNPNGVPAAGSLVEIGTSISITGSAPNIPAQILINGGATVTLDLSMTIGDGLVMANALEIATNSTLNIGFSQMITINAPTSHNGVNIDGAASSANFSLSTGAILTIIQAQHGISNASANSIVANSGTININNVSANGIQLSDGAFNNSKDINITSAGDNGIYNDGGKFSNASSADIEIEDANNIGIENFSSGTFTNIGTIEVTNPGMTTLDGIQSYGASTSFTNSGTLTITKPDDDGIEIIESSFTNTGTIDLTVANAAGTENVGIALSSNGAGAEAELNNNSGTINIDGGISASGRGIYVYPFGNLKNKSTINLSNGDDATRIYVRGKVNNQLGGTINLNNGRVVVNQGGFQNNGLVESTRGTSGISSDASTTITNNGFFDYTGSNDFATGAGSITDDGIDLNDVSEMVIDAGGGCAINIANVSYEYFSGANSVGTSDASGMLTFNNNTVISDPATLTNSLGISITVNNICAAALPIELVYFTAIALEREVSIKWQTATETNNDYMAVEKSIDGRTFSEIGRVQGAGFSDELITYELIDPQPIRGQNYYRLRQVDFDGTASYSVIEVVEFKNNISEFEIYPTLLVGDQELTISINQLEGAAITLELFSTNGQLIRQYHFSGATSYSLNMMDLSKGMYTLRGSGKYSYLVNRFIKVD